jgi:hypothetical protein
VAVLVMPGLILTCITPYEGMMRSGLLLAFVLMPHGT